MILSIVMVLPTAALVDIYIVWELWYLNGALIDFTPFQFQVIVSIIPYYGMQVKLVNFSSYDKG